MGHSSNIRINLLGLKINPLIIDYIIITFGLLLYTFVYTYLILPHKLNSGGVTGLATVIHYATDIPFGYLFSGLNIVLIIIGGLILGWNFGFKTIYALIVLIISFNIIKEPAAPLIDDILVSVVLGGGLIGVGVGLVISRGGTTAGTDILIMIINKYFDVTPGKLFMFFDIIIVSSTILVIPKLDNLVYCYISMGLVGFMVDKVLTGIAQSSQILIFSNKSAEIANLINSNVHRGVTMLKGQGWHSKDEMNIVLTIVRRREVGEVFREVRSVDPNAFITVGTVRGVYGQGFDRMKK
ncbi:MAG: YitT family protein [Bacteroidales bacterium]